MDIMSIQAGFGVDIDKKEFEERFLALHKQLFASSEHQFNDVCTHVFTPPQGMSQFDHCFVHDEKNWHLFYGTGDMTLSEEWIKRFKAGDWDGTNEVCLEPGNGHAVGPNLFELKFHDHVFFPPQGRFDLASRGVCSIFSFDGRYGMLYDVRGENYIGMSLAWSDDLYNWELDQQNPYLSWPNWAVINGSCKDPHVMHEDGLYLIYYIVMDQQNYCCVALATTTDWKNFHDHGCVFRSAPMLRGTMGIESPCVVRRNGLWHLFFTYGPGLWHAVSMSSDGFVANRENPWDVGTGFYYVGPFHATEIIQAPDGDWWMTTDRKEETRRLNRQAGRLCYRGSYEDDKTLEEGIYLSHIHWNGDQPILEKPVVMKGQNE